MASTTFIDTITNVPAAWLNDVNDRVYDDVVNVKNYGAVGDGVTDDSAAIVSAMTAAAGKALYFPAGTYLTNPIVVGTSVGKIYGDGPYVSTLYIQRSAHAAAAIMISVASNTAQCLFTDLGVDVNNAVFAATHTVECNSSNIRFNNMYFNGQGAFGIYFTNGVYNRVTDCKFVGTGTLGFNAAVYSFVSASQVSVQGCDFTGVHAYAVNLSSGTNNTIENCRSVGAASAAGGFAFSINNSTRGRISGNYAVDSGYEAFQLTNSRFCTIANNIAEWTTAGADFGMSMNGAVATPCDYNTMSNNILINSFKCGVAIANQAQYNHVIGNTFLNCAVRENLAGSAIMAAYTDVTACQAYGNRFENNICSSSSGTVANGYIEVNTGGGGSDVNGNVLNGNYFLGTITNKVTMTGSVSRWNDWPRNGLVLLGELTSANFNSTADQLIRINASKWALSSIRVDNASISLTTAAGGFYSGAAKSGTTFVAAGQVYSACTAANKIAITTLAGTVTTDTHTGQTMYLSLTTAQGAAATARVQVYGYIIEE